MHTLQFNYNEELEKEMDQLLKPLYECSKGNEKQFFYLVEELENSYLKTNYPGYLYRIGFICEKYKFYNHKDYYQRAADLDFVPAINRMNELFLEEIQMKMMINGHMFSKPYYYDDSYGKYLLAKFYMMESICSDSMGSYFKFGLSIMKESVEAGCKEAIEFMKTINVDEISELL